MNRPCCDSQVPSRTSAGAATPPIPNGGAPLTFSKTVPDLRLCPIKTRNISAIPTRATGTVPSELHRKAPQLLPPRPLYLGPLCVLAVLPFNEKAADAYIRAIVAAVSVAVVFSVAAHSRIGREHGHPPHVQRHRGEDRHHLHPLGTLNLRDPGCRQ